MKTLLQDLMVFPEVTAAVVCDYKHGLLTATELPSAIRGKPLAGICQSLGRLFASRDTITTIELRFPDSLLLASPVSKNVTLLTFCVPSVNVPLVNMTISMLLPNLQVAAAAMDKPPSPPLAKPAAKPTTKPEVATPAKPAAKPAAPTAPAKPEVTAPAKPAAPIPAATAPTKAAQTPVKPVDVEAMFSTGPLARTLSEFQAAMAYAIGPVGEMVMRDAVGEWGKGGECTEKRLSELVVILCREIDDPDLEKEFQEKVKAFL